MLKIHSYRAASLNSEFTGSYKKVVLYGQQLHFQLLKIIDCVIRQTSK